MLQDRCHSPAFRPYTSTDVLGCELGGAYKNVVGLAVGMAVGLGFGDNTTASVITRGLAETARLAMKLGANPLTLMGLAGLGDLVATCSSPLSRNRTFGEKLGQGMTTEEIYASTRQVAEGAKSCSSLRALAEQSGVDAPVAQYVDDVVAGRMTAPEMMDAILARETKAETTSRPVRNSRESTSNRLKLSDGSPPLSESFCRVSVRRALGQVRPEVLDVLDADREAHQVRRAPRWARAPSAGGVRGSTRRRRATWCAPRAGSTPETASAASGTGREQDRHHRAEARVAHLGDGRVVSESAGELGGVRLRALHPDVQGAQAAQRQPRLERARDRALQVAPALEHLPQRVVARSRPRPSAGRCGRRGTSSPSAPRCRRPGSAAAGAGEWRRCCRRPRDAPASCAAAAMVGDVGELERRVGRRLQPHQRDVVVQRRDEAGGVLDVDEPRRDRGRAPRGRRAGAACRCRRSAAPPRSRRWRRGRARSRPRRDRDENASARPPSRSPSAASKACQVGLPVRPYSRSPPATYVEAIVIGVLSGWSGSCGGRPACTTRVAGRSGSAMPPTLGWAGDRAVARGGRRCRRRQGRGRRRRRRR